VALDPKWEHREVGNLREGEAPGSTRSYAAPRGKGLPFGDQEAISGVA